MIQFLLTLALCLAATTVEAQTQIELTLQAREDAERVQAQVDAQYARIMAEVDQSAQERLAKAQAAWTAFRDKQCLWEGDWYRGGSASPYQYNLCWKRLAETRLAELKDPMNLQQLKE